MNIKNYTSTITAEKSIQNITAYLVKNGANSILSQYEAGELKSISFVAEVNGNSVPFRIEAETENIYKLLIAESKRPTQKTFENAREQAKRTAWKIIADWVEINMTLVMLQQAEFMQVFLPYVYDPARKQTVYQRFKDTNFKLLES